MFNERLAGSLNITGKIVSRARGKVVFYDVLDSNQKANDLVPQEVDLEDQMFFVQHNTKMLYQEELYGMRVLICFLCRQTTIVEKHFYRNILWLYLSKDEFKDLWRRRWKVKNYQYQFLIGLKKVKEVLYL